MTPKDLATAIRLWESFTLDRGDLDPDEVRLLGEAVFDPDIEYVEDPRWPGSRTFEGPEAVVARFLEYNEVLGERHALTVEGVIDAGEEILSLCRHGTAGERSDVPIDHLWAYVGRLRGDRWLTLQAYWEPAEAIAALGLGHFEPSDEAG